MKTFCSFSLTKWAVRKFSNGLDTFYFRYFTIIYYHGLKMRYHISMLYISVFLRQGSSHVRA